MGSPRSQKTIMRTLLEELISGAPKFEAKSGSQQVTLYLVTCRPDLAARILEQSNIGNRKVRQKKIAEFARSMQRGAWLIKSTMEFFESGRVHDGQHRLLACRDAGVAVPFLVQLVRDQDANVHSVVTDIGVPRNLSDYLHFQGVYEAQRTASFLVYERNYRVSGCPFQSCQAERGEYLKLYQEIEEAAVKAAYDLVPSRLYRTLGVQRAFLDWFAYQTAKIDAEAATLFLGYVLEPVGSKKTDAVFLLNQMLLALAKQDNQKAVSLVQQATLMVKGWNLNYEHQPATDKNLRYRVTEEWPVLKGAVTAPKALVR